MRFGKLALAALFVVGASQVQAQNLVTNPGFETGDFTGWTTTNAPSGSRLGVRSNPPYVPHSGSYVAYFGDVGPTPTVDDDIISQVLPTVAGNNYSLDFFLANNGDPSNDFSAQVDGVPLLTILDSAAFPYTEFSYTFLGAGADTLTFRGRQVPSVFLLDDITVRDLGPAAAPEPGTLALLASFGLTGAAFLARRRKQAQKAA